MKSSFVRSKQETGSYCGPAVVQMLVSSFGKSVDQKSIVEACGATGNVMKFGIALNSLVVGVKKLFPDLVIWQKSNSSVEEIKTLSEMGYLVAFDWQGIFSHDEYGDDEFASWWERAVERLTGAPSLKGDQGHYCVALEVNLKKGYLRFADPYGHFAGKDRFVALWELEERWWDDRIDTDESGKKAHVLEEKLVFLMTTKDDQFPASLGMEKA